MHQGTGHTSNPDTSPAHMDGRPAQPPPDDGRVAPRGWPAGAVRPAVWWLARQASGTGPPPPPNCVEIAWGFFFKLQLKNLMLQKRFFGP